ncbi:hypothetical protein HOP50_02g17790 [Chloropicon primus]|uniref:Uncharacterized protein n=1 Tax=Chloropicon primus TaxID=1764295 RepID=A0A5B8MGQ7_9CHLO|nr:hypothetical protein A3770_02p17820 [Chloropicon primus]UPQ98473.1 hypothetical protein HOP50_02g17790 [Chloropicon primus]|eukprot:QDZ19264.1 hypothetical protein A3770_02p17820 [Chloropicon primus]
MAHRGEEVAVLFVRRLATDKALSDPRPWHGGRESGAGGRGDVMAALRVVTLLTVISISILMVALYGAWTEVRAIAGFSIQSRKLLSSEHPFTDGKEALKHNLEFLTVELFSLAAAEVIDVSVEGSL